LASSAILAQYDFTTGVVTSSDTDSSSTAGNFTVTNGGTVGGGAGFSTTTNMAFFRSDGLTGTEAGAVAAPDYFSFTITPTTGPTSLTSLTFLFGGSTSTAVDGTFDPFVSIRTSAEAVPYNTNIGTATRNVPNTGTANQLSSFSINLTNIPELQNFTTPVTFRLYVYAENAGTAAEILRLDTVVLNGVPESSAILLSGAGILLAATRRRRICH
jgi:hypothetical protein